MGQEGAWSVEKNEIWRGRKMKSDPYMHICWSVWFFHFDGSKEWQNKSKFCFPFAAHTHTLGPLSIARLIASAYIICYRMQRELLSFVYLTLWCPSRMNEWQDARIHPLALHYGIARIYKIKSLWSSRNSFSYEFLKS